jgi:fumarate reductase flavoprotein subunit
MNMADTKCTADLVVIGGGAAGMPAALEAMEKGLRSVILIDKSPFPGGNARMAGGYVFAADAYTQREAGVTLHCEDVYKKTLAFHHSDGINPRVLKAFIDRSADNLDWLLSKGIRYEYNPLMGNGIVGAGAPGSYAKVIDKLKSEFLERGGTILAKTTVRELLQKEDGTVCGVIAEGKDGTITEIETSAVIISTGGFLGNSELMDRYFSDQYDPAAYVSDALKFDGSGIALAEKAGAKLAPKATLCKESGYSFANRRNRPHRISMYRNAVWINRDGVRFCDESTAHEHTNANLLVMQPGMVGYTIMDENMMEDIIAHPAPQVNNEFLAPGDPKIRLQLQEAARQTPDQCLIANSLEEIAVWLDIEPAVLEDTIDRYNRDCEKGEDTEFCKSAEFMVPLRQPPYYVCRFHPLMIETIGPVMVNHHFQVLSAESGKPIPGLYAAGAIVSGWQGHDYKLWGANLGFGLSSGRIAADHIAAAAGC